MRLIGSLWMILFLLSSCMEGRNGLEAGAFGVHADTVSSDVEEHIQPEDIEPGYFGAPLDGPLDYAGTFCELRNNHFHSGVDIRTGGQEGMPVKSVADGHVVRIRVWAFGLGKALYIAHPNGITSMYAHLRNFSDRIEAYLQKEQYKQQSYEVDIYPHAGELKVAKGELVAYSGNTGGSAGPHLHFELRSTRTEHALNPLRYGIPFEDHLPPKIFKMGIYQLNNVKNSSNGRYPVYFFDPSLQTPIKVPPGSYGLSYYGNDYGKDYQFKHGINYLSLESEGSTLFKISIEELDFAKSRSINHHADYYTLRTTGVWYVKLFEEAFNPLPYYVASNRGILQLKHGDSLTLKLRAKDLKGQEVLKTIRIQCNDQHVFRPSAQKSFTGTAVTCYPDKANYKNFEGFKWTIPSGVLYDTFTVYYKNTPSTKYLSHVHQFHQDLVAMHSPSTISIKPVKGEHIPREKLCIVNTASGKYEGGSFSNGWVNTTVKQFGSYAVNADTVAPRIRLIGRNGRHLRFAVSDNLSGVKQWNAWVNGEWFLLEYEPKYGVMFGNVPEKFKGSKQNVRVLVQDDKFNKFELNQIIQF